MTELETQIEKIVNYNLDIIAREADFGKSGFQDAVEPTRRIQELFKLLSLEKLYELPPEQMKSIQSTATNILNTLQAMSQFNLQHHPSQRQELIQRFMGYYQQGFNTLLIPALYTQFRTLNIQESVARVKEAVDIAQTHAETKVAELEAKSKEVDKVLDDVRKAAAEQGVSQQATYFKADSEEHAGRSLKWGIFTFILAALILAAAIGSLFIHKWPILVPTTAFDSYQLIASKILIFAVLSYMLVLSSRNFLSHKHNAVVNKHRQNALMTFKALADAAADPKLKDIILTHASACIFTPQDTGYTKAGGTPSFSGGKSVIELIQAAGKGGE